jgi:hypothetical protein
MNHFFGNAHLDGMWIMKSSALPAFVALTLLSVGSCESKDTLLRVRDGAADLGAVGAGGTGTGGAAGHLGTGGIIGVGSGGATTMSGTGGGGSGGTTVGGSGGTAGGGSGGIGFGGSGGGSAGTGGGAKDGGQPDGAGDGAADAPASDDGASCGTGYPVGSQKPQGDGCNTCYCQSGGYWMCTTAQCPPADVAPEVSGDSGQCPAGQMWCPGCTPGTGSCGAVCTGAPCLVPDAGCSGSGCSTADAATARDVSGAEAGAATCSQVTTQAECDVRSDCHSVFRSLGACGCGSAGCCMRFDRCADGKVATCDPPASFGCTIATPLCDSPYVLSYTPGCWEGCVNPAECSQ